MWYKTDFILLALAIIVFIAIGIKIGKTLFKKS